MDVDDNYNARASTPPSRTINFAGGTKSPSKKLRSPRKRERTYVDVEDSDEDVPSRRPKSPSKKSSAGNGGSCSLLLMVSLLH